MLTPHLGQRSLGAGECAAEPRTRPYLGGAGDFGAVAESYFMSCRGRGERPMSTLSGPSHCPIAGVQKGSWGALSTPDAP